MTVNKTGGREAKHGGASALRTYLASLAYLREEAKSDGLDAIAQIIRDTLAAIEEWLDTGAARVSSHEVLDSSLCHALEFLLKWLALPPARQRAVEQNIARYETPTKPFRNRRNASVKGKRANGNLFRTQT